MNDQAMMLGRFNFTPHAHECRHCGTVWAHDPNDPNHTEWSFSRAHDCPQCGTHQSKVYQGPHPPALVHDGLHKDTALGRSQYVEEEDETRPVPGSGLRPSEHIARATARKARLREMMHGDPVAELFHQLFGY